MKQTGIALLLLLSMGLTAKSQEGRGEGRINITKLIAYEKDNRFYIDWSTDGKVATNIWEVQSSADGKHFTTIAMVLGADPTKPGDEYSYRGKTEGQKPGTYYRVVHKGRGGMQESEMIKTMKLESVSFINPEIRSKTPNGL